MTWSIGQLAAAAGLTVRALHHYEEIGLLVPAQRTEAGHRRYGAAEVDRLYRIVALRACGLPLAEIAGALDAGGDVREIARRHLAQVERRIAEAQRLRLRLRRLLDAPVAPDDLIELIEETTMHERHYTSGGLEELARRAERLGPDGLECAQREWEELIAEVERHRTAGADPSDPALAPLMVRWRELVAAFTGGDRGTEESLRRMYEQEGAERASRGAMSAELAEYVRRAMAAS